MTDRFTKTFWFDENEEIKIPTREIDRVNVTLSYADGTKITAFLPDADNQEKQVKNPLQKDDLVITRLSADGASALAPDQAIFERIRVINTDHKKADMVLTVTVDADTSIIDPGTGTFDGEKLVFRFESVAPGEAAYAAFTTQVSGEASTIKAKAEYNGIVRETQKTVPVLTYGKVVLFNELTGSGKERYKDQKTSFRVKLYDTSTGRELSGTYSYSGSRTGMIKSGDTISLSGNEYVKIDPGYYKNVTYEIEKIENGLHHTEKMTSGSVDATRGNGARFTRNIEDTAKRTIFKPGETYVLMEETVFANGDSLINAWHAAYMNYPDEFAGLQSRTAYEAYYLPAQRGMLSNYGINIKEYSPALRGTIWSLAIRNGGTVSTDNTRNGLRSATSTYSPGSDEREWLTKIYEAEAKRHPSQRKRWGTEQLAACFAFMNGATHLGGLDGNYDGAFIGSLNTSAAAGGVSNAMMLNAIKNDVVLTESDYRILKINRDTLLYLLQKAYDYETQYMLQRSITVYGLREYQIEHEDEEGSWYEDAEEYVSKQILVSNEDTECMLRLDWQMLYMYSILASMGREDRGETEGIWDWEITIKDVDVAFDQIAMKYDYAFNVMTDEKSEYDFATCQSLPHKTEIYGDPDTTSGRYTWYYPNSLLRSASSGYSDLAYTYSGGEINGIVETYQNERYKGIPAALTRYYNFDRFHTLAKYMPGGTEALSRYEAYNQRAVMGNPIIYSGNFEVSMGEWNLVSE